MNLTSCDLSIVIVSFNTVTMTRACLDSVFNKTGGINVQVILVDNASSDNSVQMVRESFPEVELIVNDENKGFAAANNQGFRIARGKFVLLLNSDTLVLKNVLSDSVTYLCAHPEVGAMGCRVLNTDGSMQATCSGYPTIFRLILLTIGISSFPVFRNFDNYLMPYWKRDSERDVEVISGCYLLLRREVLEQIGNLDESFFFFGEETDWCLRMREAGWVLRFAPIGEIIHHGGGSVKKLNHFRDVMLTGALVRLHLKNSGRVPAFFVFLILLVFNVSRAAFWTVCKLLLHKGSERASHFQKVVINSFSAWPKG